MLRRNFVLLAASRIGRPLNYCTHQYSFEIKEKIALNFLNNIMLIGLNEPEKKNILTEKALDKLRDSFDRFEKDENLSVAILHGIGGNFCTGLEPTEKAVVKGNIVIEMMHKSKKPILGSLHGQIKSFGFQLALMCDMRAIDETALIGFGDRETRLNVHEEVYKRLVSLVGVSRALEMTLLQCNWSAVEAQSFGLVNKSVECGTALGKVIVWAQSIVKVPLQVTIQEKTKIFSVLHYV